MAFFFFGVILTKIWWWLGFLGGWLWAVYNLTEIEITIESEEISKFCLKYKNRKVKEFWWVSNLVWVGCFRPDCNAHR